jgi:hypothetical protein
MGGASSFAVASASLSECGSLLPLCPLIPYTQDRRPTARAPVADARSSRIRGIVARRPAHPLRMPTDPVYAGSSPDGPRTRCGCPRPGQAPALQSGSELPHSKARHVGVLLSCGSTLSAKRFWSAVACYRFAPSSRVRGIVARAIGVQGQAGPDLQGLRQLGPQDRAAPNARPSRSPLRPLVLRRPHDTVRFFQSSGFLSKRSRKPGEEKRG